VARCERITETSIKQQDEDGRKSDREGKKNMVGTIQSEQELSIEVLTNGAESGSSGGKE
jgi:hypothetical protein